MPEKTFQFHFSYFWDEIEQLVPYKKSEIIKKIQQKRTADIYWELALFYALTQNVKNIELCKAGADIKIPLETATINIECKVIKQSKPQQMTVYKMPTVQQQHIDFFNNPDGIHQWSPQTDDVAYLKNKWKEAIDEKIKQYNSWLESKVVADTDINIIAITYGDSFSASGYCSPISDASAFLFGVSDSCVATVYQDGSSKCETTLNQSSDFVIQDKNNEAKIKKQASFCSKGSNKISGVLFIPDSHKIIDCFTVAVIFVKNPNAINIIDDLLLEKIFKVLRVEEIKDNKFCTTDIISPENQKLLNDYKINTQKLAKDYLNGSITAEVYQDEILGLGRK